MDKKQFLLELKEQFKIYGIKDYQDFISDYDELIEDYLEDGYSFEDIIKKIGTPKMIVSKLATQDGKGFSNYSSGMKILIIILLVLGSPLWICLVASLFLLLLSAYIMIWLIPFLLFVFALAGAVTGVACLGTSFFVLQDGAEFFVLYLGVGTFAVGIGILFSIAMFNVIHVFARTTKKFTKWVFGKFRRRVIYE